MTESTAQQIALTFNREFDASHRIVMRGGGEEPLYEPGDVCAPACIVYTRDYPASALHEAAHWCLAGAARRRLRDYGYWYVPGPRDAAQRAAFFAAEVEVQALEAVFALTSGVRFVPSADDFAAAPEQLEHFTRIVGARIKTRLGGTLPSRARRFHDALRAEFRRGGC